MRMEIKITVIKFEVVNGKKTGKSLSFNMDPVKMAQYKTPATVRRRVEEKVATYGVFRYDELKELKYDMKEFLAEWRKQVAIQEAQEEALINKPEIRPKSA